MLTVHATIASGQVTGNRNVLHLNLSECHNNCFCPDINKSEGKGDYSAFTSDGVVSLPGQRDVSVKILRGTGATHSFVRESILPF